MVDGEARRPLTINHQPSPSASKQVPLEVRRVELAAEAGLICRISGEYAGAAQAVEALFGRARPVAKDGAHGGAEVRLPREQGAEGAGMIAADPFLVGRLPGQ